MSDYREETYVKFVLSHRHAWCTISRAEFLPVTQRTRLHAVTHQLLLRPTTLLYISDLIYSAGSWLKREREKEGEKGELLRGSFPVLIIPFASYRSLYYIIQLSDCVSLRPMTWGTNKSSCVVVVLAPSCIDLPLVESRFNCVNNAPAIRVDGGC